MKKSKFRFMAAEVLLLVLTLFFVYKIFNQNIEEPRVAIILPESGDQRWDALLEGMKQSASLNKIHLIICNTDEIEDADAEREAIREQLDNQVDAFIICPSPGSETKEMLENECADIPILLITEDIYDEEQKASGLPVIKPDYYEIGQTLAARLQEDGQRRIGVVGGWRKSDISDNGVRGLNDALEGTDCEVVWYYYNQKEKKASEMVSVKEKVDALVVLDPDALVELGEQAENGTYYGAKIYGIGSSVKSIALLDYGYITDIVLLDGYEIGYKSIEEIAEKLNHRFYQLESCNTGVRELDGEELFSNDDMERLLYSYE